MLYIMSYLKSFVFIYQDPHLVFSSGGRCLRALYIFLYSNKVRAYRSGSIL